MSDRPIRVQLRRIKGWRMPENTVKVDRTTIYGNPYVIDEQCQHLSWFRADLLKEMASQSPTEPDHRLSLHFWKMGRAMRNLRGRNLACWCKPGSECHADILLEIANTDDTARHTPSRNALRRVRADG